MVFLIVFHIIKLINNPKINAVFRSIIFITLYVLFGALLSQLKVFVPAKFERFTQGVLGTVAIFAVVLVFLRFENKKFRDYGLNWERKTLLKFTKGLSLGLVLATAMMLSQVHYSQLELHRNIDLDLIPFFLWSLAFIPLAFMEEIAFRSYPLLELNKVLNFRITQLILAILFAFYHVIMLWGVREAFLGPGIWALLYALTAVQSNGIALPTGLHFGLNFVQSVLGGQEGIEPLWFVEYPSDVTEKAIQANENFGLGLQISLLIILVIATEIYIRKKKRKL